MCNNQNIQSYPQVNSYAQNTAPYSVPQAAAQYTQPVQYAQPVQQQTYTQYDASGAPLTVSATETVSIQAQGVGGSVAGIQASEGMGNPMVNISAQSELPETLTHYEYIPGFLRAHIGALMRVEFLVADHTTDRVGRLTEVGASYIVLHSLDDATQMMCDLYSIKFVTILQAATPQLVAESALQNQALNLG